MDDSRSQLEIGHLGAPDTAWEILRRAGETVPAYRRHLDCHGLGEGRGPEAYPLTDKSGYLRQYPYRDLLGDDSNDSFTIFASSGSSGASFFWPQLRSRHQQVIPRLQQFLEASFDIRNRRTMAIVGLALGSWIGGEHMSWALKSLALAVDYPLCVFSPGSNHEEIIRMIASSDPYVEQFILCLCPSAIAHIRLRAEEAGMALPLHKIRFVVLGEAFPESVRISLQRQAGLPEGGAVMLSIYGSADTGLLGVESAASVALRRLLVEFPDLADDLGIGALVPHFFHNIAPDAYLETMGGELLITRWQGVPLLRYNLHDSVRLFSWKRTRRAVLELLAGGKGGSASARLLEQAGDGLPDLLVVAGRSDSTLILCGTNISEAMLDAAVRCRELEPYLTGVYRAAIDYDGDRQRLALELEFGQGRTLSPGEVDEVYGLLVRALGRVQPEFLDDWRNVYQIWDNDPAKRILDLRCSQWPALSDMLAKGIKHRGIRA